MNFRDVMWAGALVVLSTLVLSTTASAQLVRTFGGGLTASTPCMTQEQQLELRRVMTDYWARELASSPLPAGALAASSSPPKFEFYPLGGNLYGDLFTNNFNDLDPSGGIQDWDCTGYTYNGHDATDVEIRSWAEQAIGVPIFAAADGTVIGLNDGEPDMNTDCSNPQANYVILAHAGGRNTYYWHMRTGSVAVTQGQVVKAGEQLGLVASSGCSTAPHLHFATYDNFGSTRVEPYAGPCNPGVSQWEDQTPLRRDVYIGDLNLTSSNFANWTGPPETLPHLGTLSLGLRSLRFWTLLYNVPASFEWRVRLRTPSGSLYFDSGIQSWGTSPFYRRAWSAWIYNFNFNTTGTWELEVEIEGTATQSVPLEIVASAAQIQNRPPFEVEAHFDPPSPTLDDVLFCRLDADLARDDPDCDVVQYEYTWHVNNVLVRQITSAGHADAIPHHVATKAGDVITCTVVPSDGLLSANPTTVTVRVSPEGYEEFCFGDGPVTAGCTSCPCGNDAASGSLGGCLNSVGESARMLVVGSSAVSGDTLRIEMRSGSPNSFGILTSGSSRAPAVATSPCFGLDTGIQSPSFDGLRCAVQGVLRHGTRATDASGDIGSSNPGWGASSGPPSGLLAFNGFVAGQTRHFQIVYRDDVLASCGRGQNTTQGGTVTIAP